jgi:hypothetical protein
MLPGFVQHRQQPARIRVCCAGAAVLLAVAVLCASQRSKRCHLCDWSQPAAGSLPSVHRRAFL